jgi:hypothetical protein
MVQKLDGIYKASKCVDWEADITIFLICEITVKIKIMSHHYYAKFPENINSG